MAAAVRTVVFCGAKPGNKAEFGEKAAELGKCLAERGVEVIYGGSRYGCMGRLADAVVAAGGTLTGIVPKFFTEMEGYSTAVEEIVVPNMHTRKQMFFERASMFIALPGGIGTMEELTEMLTWQQLKLHSKPIGLLNVDDYYSSFLQWLSRAREEGFVKGGTEVLIVSNSPKELVDLMLDKLSKIDNSTLSDCP